MSNILFITATAFLCYHVPFINTLMYALDILGLIWAVIALFNLKESIHRITLIMAGLGAQNSILIPLTMAFGLASYTFVGHYGLTITYLVGLILFCMCSSIIRSNTPSQP